MFEKAGTITAGFDVKRVLPKDAEENRDRVAYNGQVYGALHFLEW